MELVPILSTIILVGTIATFILAVFAYILYKVRERRTREAAGQQRQYVETRRTQMAPAVRPAGIGQPSVASMYIAPTTTLPPQGPVVEVEDLREAVAPSGGWQQPPSLERAVAAPPAFDRADANAPRRPAQRIARPQPHEAVEAGRRIEAEAGREPSSLFWEYTDEGFVPVDPTRPTQREEARVASRRRDDDEDSAWL